MLQEILSNEGFITMLVGMCTVFSFLLILWISVLCMSKVVGYLNKIFPAEVKSVTTSVKNVVEDIEVAIAIAAAKLRK